MRGCVCAAGYEHRDARAARPMENIVIQNRVIRMGCRSLKARVEEITKAWSVVNKCFGDKVSEQTGCQDEDDKGAAVTVLVIRRGYCLSALRGFISGCAGSWKMWNPIDQKVGVSRWGGRRVPRAKTQL